MINKPKIANLKTIKRQNNSFNSYNVSYNVLSNENSDKNGDSRNNNSIVNYTHNLLYHPPIITPSTIIHTISNDKKIETGPKKSKGKKSTLPKPQSKRSELMRLTKRNTKLIREIDRLNSEFKKLVAKQLPLSISTSPEKLNKVKGKVGEVIRLFFTV